MSNNATHNRLHLRRINGKWKSCCEWADGKWEHWYRLKKTCKRPIEPFELESCGANDTGRHPFLASMLILGLILAPLGAAPSIAAEGVFLDTEVARRLVGEVYAGRECAEQLSLCDSQLKNAEEQARILEEGVRAGEAGNVALRQEADALSANLKDVAADLSKCEESKPSRLTWMAVGGAIVAAIFGALALK